MADKKASRIDYFGKVLIDLTGDDVAPENLDEGVKAHDKTGSQIVGTRKAIKLQEKSVTPSTSAQTVTPDNTYDGLSKVNVDKIPDDYIIPSGTKQITQNGTHDVKAYESATVNVPSEDLAPEIATQKQLIADIQTALAGKASGGVKIATGTMATLSEEEPCSVDLGFIPDIIEFLNLGRYSVNEGAITTASVVATLREINGSSANASEVYSYLSDNKLFCLMVFPILEAEADFDGFGLMPWVSSGGWQFMSNTTFDYVAIKYTA